MNEATTEVGKSPPGSHAGPTCLATPDPQSTGIVRQRLRQDAPIQKHSEWNIRNILVPTDYSPKSNKALQRAVCIANQCDAAITILHVVDVNAPAKLGTAQDLMQGLWTDASKNMANLAFSLAGQVNAQTVIEEGIPCEIIAEKSGEFDLIVLAKGHRGRPWRPFSKHTASRVIENAACPVMVVQERD